VGLVPGILALAADARNIIYQDAFDDGAIDKIEPMSSTRCSAVLQ
jgi:hypothetical protein